jgi:glycerol-3-phosphate O-acyltransferase
METLGSAYKDLIKGVLSVSDAAARISPENVYQKGNEKVRPYIDKLLEDLLLPGSGFDGVENIIELLEKALAGHSCLILPEHYSNTDLPCISYFLKKHSHAGARADESLVAIAGMKLNEQNPQIAALASAFSRIVICPSRYLDTVDGEKDPEERLRVIQINRASMHALNELKAQGKLILVFPAGTRYRPWDPASKRGVREIDSYIKSFDYMCLISINGQVLKVRESDMIDDYVEKDVVRLAASPVIRCPAFRAKVKDQAEKDGVEDKKQAVVDAVMELLDQMHAEIEPKRQAIIDDS